MIISCPKCKRKITHSTDATVIKDLFTKAYFKTEIYKCVCGFEIMCNFERVNVENIEKD